MNAKAARIKVVSTVQCPRCWGQGTTAGHFSAAFGNVEQGVERCRYCDGRGVVTSEVWTEAEK